MTAAQADVATAQTNVDKAEAEANAAADALGTLVH